MYSSTIGIDLAKTIFHLHEVNNETGEVIKKKLSRKKLMAYMTGKAKNLVGVEACGSSNYWARELTLLGHEVKIIAPQFVKPYVTGNKNDAIDAAAIYEAMTRPTMRFVPVKTSEQQDVQMLHRIRSRLVKNRTALGNEIRGFMLEYGIALAKGHGVIRNKLLDIMEDKSDNLTDAAKEEFEVLQKEFMALDEKINMYEKRLSIICASNSDCRRLQTIPGIGLITSTALVCSIGDIGNFENSRQLAAWLGLVPRQHSTGGKNVLLGISKRGDKYLRQLLVHGGRAIIRSGRSKKDKGESLGRLQEWVVQKYDQKGYNQAAVAAANKLARIVWVLLTKKEDYRLMGAQAICH